MDILVVSHLYPTPDDPVTGVFVHEQVKALRERGHTVRVLSPRPYVPAFPGLPERWRKFSETPRGASIDEVPVSYPRYLSLPSRRTLPLVSLSARWTLSRQVRELPPDFLPDVVHAHVPLPDGYASFPAAEQLGVPQVVTVHGASIQKAASNPISRRQIGTVFDQSAAVIFNSEVLQNKARAYFNTFDTAHVVHNGIPIESVTAASPANLPEPFEADRLVVTSVGSILPEKGQWVVVNAIKQLPESMQPNYLVIGDGPERERLEEAAAEIESSVHFTGTVPNREVFSYLKASDVMALPSTEEAFGVAYVEAMACNCTVIGCQGEGPSEFVTDGETGYLVPHDDPDAVATRLRDLIANPTQLGQMGAAASTYVKENLTRAENAKKTEEILKAAL